MTWYPRDINSPVPSSSSGLSPSLEGVIISLSSLLYNAFPFLCGTCPYLFWHLSIRRISLSLDSLFLLGILHLSGREQCQIPVKFPFWPIILTPFFSTFLIHCRLFGAKCAKCSESFDKNDFVMRARNKIYHTECFCCEACTRQLVSGDEFAVRDDRLFCEVCIRSTVHPLFSPSCDSHDSSQTQLPTIYDGKNPPVNGGDTVVGQTIVHENRSPSEHTILSSTRHHHHHREERSGRNHHNGHHKGNSDHKPTRVRTVLNEKQLHTLRSCYQQNPRPDALMKEQLVEMTGLSPRVIRVWFQNKRCKDKKRSILMKQMQQQEKVRKRI